MPRQLAITLLTVILTATVAHAQTDTTTNKSMFALKSDLLFPVLGSIGGITALSLTGEIGFKKRHSVQITEIYILWRSAYSKDTYSFTIEEYKFFLSNKKSFTGFYSGVMAIQYYARDIENHQDGSLLLTYDITEYRLGAGALLGYQNYIKKRFVVDVLIGFGYVELLKKNVYLSSDPFLRAGVNIGYRF